MDWAKYVGYYRSFHLFENFGLVSRERVAKWAAVGQIVMYYWIIDHIEYVLVFDLFIGFKLDDLVF